MNLSAGEIAKAAGGVILSGDPLVRAQSIATDSGKVRPGSLFVPVIGKKVDGHRFIAEAFKKGASISFSSHGPADCPAGQTLIGVKDTVSALQDLGAYFRKTYVHIPVIGVTGSAGKTTTREMTALALSGKYMVYATPGNANSQVGVPITICDTPPDAGIAVLELGVSEIGEMAKIAAVARPESAVVTLIGESHIAQFKSKDTTFSEKLGIAAYIDKGLLLVNGDDERLSNIRTDKRLLTYGFKDGVSYRAIGAVSTLKGTDYELLGPGGLRLKVSLGVPGEHMVYDSLAAIAMAVEYGADPEDAALRLSSFRPLSGRLEIRDIGGIKVINDAYNASPESMRESLRVLDKMAGNRRIGVIADMLELGESEERLHRELGSFIANELHNLDILILYGELTQYTADTLGDCPSFLLPKVYRAYSHDEIRDILKDILKPSDTLLFKGSNSTGLFKIAEELCSLQE